MKIDVQTPGFKARQELIEMVNEKVGKLSHLSDRILGAQVLMKTDKSDSRENKVCEINLAIYGNDLFTKRQATTFESALTEAVNASKRRIMRGKEKVKEHH